MPYTHRRRRADGACASCRPNPSKHSAPASTVDADRPPPGWVDRASAGVSQTVDGRGAVPVRASLA
ncbi:hypothetical protein WS62_27865 [Burkholderia sp. ABCPW 14]|nr:hypothetical protein WS62_27865 [Burkholderia sp. ABCPW 14]